MPSARTVPFDIGFVKQSPSVGVKVKLPENVSPWIVPCTNESQIVDIRLTTRVNGETRQDDRTGRLIFGFRYLINYLSTFTTLVPGDVIVTGTPTGAGARFDPPRYLKPGDVIEVEADGIGVLKNGVADEA